MQQSNKIESIIAHFLSKEHKNRHYWQEIDLLPTVQKVNSTKFDWKAE